MCEEIQYTHLQLKKKIDCLGVLAVSILFWGTDTHSTCTFMYQSIWIQNVFKNFCIFRFLIIKLLRGICGSNRSSISYSLMGTETYNFFIYLPGSRKFQIK